MNKFDAKALGINKPIELNVTNEVVERVAKANLAIAKSYDLANKTDDQIMKATLEANKLQNDLLKNVLHLSDEQIKKINKKVSSYDLESWFKEFTMAVFTVRNYGMTPLELEKLESKTKKESHHTEESKSGKTH